MTNSLVFYTNPMSRGRIIRWMLEEIGAPYEAKIVEYGPNMKTGEYSKINPMGKVPAIVHNGVVVTECAAICAYLADAFPAAGLAPAIDAPERGTYYRWMFFAAGPLEAAVVDKSLGVIIPEEKRGMVGYGSIDLTLNTLTAHLAQNDYVLGDKFSAADVYVGSHIMWGLQFGSIPSNEVFENYAKRLTSRAAAARAASIDDELIAQRG